MTTKIVYAQSRQPGTGWRAFQGVWREHGGIAMQQPDFFGTVSRYVQADVVQTRTTETDQARSYDGVGEIHYPGLAELEAGFASPGLTNIVGPHGASIFGSPNPLRLIAEEEVTWCDRQAAGKVYTWVKRPEGTAREAFCAGWRDKCRSWETDPDIRARLRSYALSVSVEADSEFDAIEEMTFDTMDEARQVFEEGQGLVGALSPAEAVSILTWQVVLMDTRQV